MILDVREGLECLSGDISVSASLTRCVSRLHTELTDDTQICQVRGTLSRETGAHSETDGQSASHFLSELQHTALTNKILPSILFYSS